MGKSPPRLTAQAVHHFAQLRLERVFQHGVEIMEAARVKYEGGEQNARDLCDAAGIAEAEVSPIRSEEHTSELQSLMRISYAVFCLKKKQTDILQHMKPHSS